MENDACHGAQSSALSYLLREVSKLASPDHDSFLDAAPPPTWINEHSRPFMVKKRQEDAHSFRIPNSCSKNTLPHIASCNPFKKVKEEIQAGKVPAVFEPHRDFSSPWKVLSLINLQCEKLLHHGGVEESDPSSVSSAAGFSHLMNKSLNAAPSVRNCTREEVPAPLSPGQEVRFCSGGAGGSETDRCVRNSRVGRCVRSHSNEKLNTASSPQLLSPLKVQRTFNPNVALWNPAPKLDHNANLSVNTEDIFETQLHPMTSVPPSSPSASLLFSITEKICSLPNQNHTVATPTPERSPVEGHSPPAPPLKCSSHNGEASAVPSATSEPELPPVQKEETAPPLTQQQGTRTRRKQPHPCRSFDILDPDFQGVMFRMDAELGRSREQCRLHIASRFSKELRKGVRKPRRRTRTSQNSFRIRSSDEESDLSTGVSTEGKICASCCTRKTPMWRDAEDGTPLCNACGIRYKKYKVRCVNCWHIPRKDGNSNSCCHKCGNFVKLTSTQRKPTS